MEVMKRCILIVCILVSAQYAFSQIPPASRPVCAWCEAEIYEPHKPGCPCYVANTDKNATPQTPQTNKHQQTSALMSDAVNLYLGILQEHFANKRLMNSTAEKFYGVEGCEDNGYVVTRGRDGYYTVWNNNAQKWQLMDPSGSTFINIILYNSRAVCVQRWLKKKWSIVDFCPNGRTDGGVVKNKIVVDFDYDSIKCVAKGAPIAVGKQKKSKWQWGLVTCDTSSGVWQHNVDDTWDGIDILPLSNNSFAIARKDNLLTLFSSDGKRITEKFYSQILPFALICKMMYFLVKETDKWGLINENGEVAVPCSYDEIKIDDNSISAQKDGKWEVLSTITDE